MNGDREKTDDENKPKHEHVRERIKRMSRDEKRAEFRHYLIGGGLLKVDVDQIFADQATLKAPDSAIDDALLKIATLAGAAFGGEPLTAPELVEILESQKPVVSPQGLVVHEESPVSLRRTRRRLGFPAA